MWSKFVKFKGGGKLAVALLAVMMVGGSAFGWFFTHKHVAGGQVGAVTPLGNYVTTTGYYWLAAHAAPSQGILAWYTENTQPVPPQMYRGPGTDCSKASYHLIADFNWNHDFRSQVSQYPPAGEAAYAWAWSPGDPHRDPCVMEQDSPGGE